MADDRNHMVEVALRDTRELPVILAMDRMVLFPVTTEEKQQAYQDMQQVAEFVQKRLPRDLCESAQKIFIAHAQALREFVNGGS